MRQDSLSHAAYLRFRSIRNRMLQPRHSTWSRLRWPWRSPSCVVIDSSSQAVSVMDARLGIRMGPVESNSNIAGAPADEGMQREPSNISVILARDAQAGNGRDLVEIEWLSIDQMERGSSRLSVLSFSHCSPSSNDCKAAPDSTLAAVQHNRSGLASILSIQSSGMQELEIILPAIYRWALLYFNC